VSWEVTTRLVSLFAVLALLLAVPASALPILVNGSFESGPPIPTEDINIPGGSTAITGWLVTGNVIDYLGPPWDVTDGVRGIDLDGNDGIGVIQQTFATTPGQAYLLRFDLSGNPHGSPLEKLMRLDIAGLTQNYSHDSSGQTRHALIWQAITFPFVASGPTSTVAFTSLSPADNSFGAVIDNVQIDQIPEPATLLLVGAGSLGLLARMRRRLFVTHN
jgi:choice-of-anchor C domain-containing protein